jgi:hypothetical protein
VTGQNGVGIVVEANGLLFTIGNRAIVSLGGYGRIVDGTWCELRAVAATALASTLEGAGYLSG